MLQYKMYPAGELAVLRQLLLCNNGETNDTYETTNAQTQKNCNRGTSSERSVEKPLEGLNFTPAKFHP